MTRLLGVLFVVFFCMEWTMDAREKCFVMKLTNVGNATVKVSGDMPDTNAIIEFGDELNARVMNGDRIKRTVEALLLNPDRISTAR